MPLSDDPRMLAPVGKRQIAIRMLRNLRNVYFNRRAYTKALQALDLLIAAEPEAAAEYRQRGVIHLQMRNRVAARNDLEAYLRLATDASDRGQVEESLRSLRSYQAGLN
jgi:regulator of sirC expression with transglutaminase-like and TPR domain